MVAVTNDHKHVGLKQQKCILLQLCRLEFQNPYSWTEIMMSTLREKGHSLSRGSKGEFIPCLFQFLVVAIIPWFVRTSLQSSKPVSSNCSLLCPHIAFSMGLCDICICLSLTETRGIAFRNHPVIYDVLLT